VSELPVSELEARARELERLLAEGGVSLEARVIERWIEGLSHPVGDEVAAGEPATGARSPRLVERILARTTREDLSWRGELRLLRGFLRERFARSRAWRLLAASVLAHLLAVPALAWLVWREASSDPPLHIEFEPPVEVPAFAEPEEEVIALEIPPLDDELFPGPRRLSGDRVWNARRRDRFALTAGADRPRVDEALLADDAPVSGAEIGWLAARSRGWIARRWEAELDDTQGLDRVGLAALVLRAEVLLDRMALREEDPAGGPDSVDASLSSTLAELSLRSGVPDGVERRLVERVLDRARSYGAWPAARDFEPLATPAAPDPDVIRWVGELVGASALERDPVGRAWLRWASAD